MRTTHLAYTCLCPVFLHSGSLKDLAKLLSESNKQISDHNSHCYPSGTNVATWIEWNLSMSTITFKVGELNPFKYLSAIVAT